MIPDAISMLLFAELGDLQKVSALSSLGQVFVNIEEPGWPVRSCSCGRLMYEFPNVL